MKNCFKSLSVVFLAMLFVVPVMGTTLYVSSSSGNDNNSGLSPDAPLQTIGAALQKQGDIMLKAGDVFYGPVQAYGRNISRYGIGENPQISGYKRIQKRRAWKRAGRNIWRIDLTSEDFSGYSEKGPSYVNNIGCLHEYDTDLIHGRKVRYRKDLKNNWDIWQTDKNGIDTTPEDFNYLYLYLTSNPNKLKLEVSMGESAIRMVNSTIDGISIKGFGFGIEAESKSIIRNCIIDAIGGMQGRGDESFICFGNGIQFYVANNIENCLVEKCRVSRCYDAGITIQASDQGRAAPKNITIKNNVIIACCEGWEDFLRNDDDIMFVNCRFSNNVVIDSGNSGFGYSDGRFKYCHVLGNNFNGDRGMIIENNVFIGGNYYCTMPYKGKYTSHKWKGNVCYIEPGSFILSNYVGTADVIRITEKGKDSEIARYRQLTGDKTTKFILSTGTEIKKLQEQFLTNEF